MNDTRNLPFEIRHLREAIELLSETVADAVTVVAKITKERQRIELALKSQKNVSKHDPVMWSKPDLSLEDLRNAIAMQWCVTIDQLCSARRGRELTAPRFAFCHIAHKRLFYTATEVSMALDYQDHTTVLHGCKRANDMLATDENFQSNYKAVWTAIQASQTPTSKEQH